MKAIFSLNIKQDQAALLSVLIKLLHKQFYWTLSWDTQRQWLHSWVMLSSGFSSSTSLLIYFYELVNFHYFLKNSPYLSFTGRQMWCFCARKCSLFIDYNKIYNGYMVDKPSQSITYTYLSCQPAHLQGACSGSL